MLLDEDAPNVARMDDYMLGGSHNFAVDRGEVDRVLAGHPAMRETTRANRRFQGRAVRWCLAHGVDQFLDLGAGIPTIGSAHEIARRSCPRARVAYVDLDPVAVAHSRGVMDGDPLLTVTEADATEPDAVLDAPGVAGLLDLDRPVGLLATAVLHFVPGRVDRLVDVLARYRARLAPGSVLVVSHGLRPPRVDASAARRLAGALRLYEHTPTSLFLRSREDIAALFDGVDLVPPGLVPVDDWPGGPPADPDRVVLGLHGGVAVMP